MAQISKVYKHIKSGHIVRVIDIARLQTVHPTSHLRDMEPMVVYVHAGATWVRAESEFDDGRFELITN